MNTLPVLICLNLQLKLTQVKITMSLIGCSVIHSLVSCDSICFVGNCGLIFTDHTNFVSVYQKEVKHCKILCATGHDQYVNNKAPDLNDTTSFQDQFVKLYHKVMECRYKCAGKHDKEIDYIKEDYLPQLLNYLQFSAYQAKDIKFAGQIAATYLLINPGNFRKIRIKYFVII